VAQVSSHEVDTIPTGRKKHLGDNLVTELGWEAIVRSGSKTIDALMCDGLLLRIRGIEGTALSSLALQTKI
jgi:hypothetical protein